MSQALYRKWRSQTFGEVVGQAHVTQTLQNALRDDRVAHAYLFAGPRGTGKTSTARILAKALNCIGPEESRPCDECANCVAIREGRMLDLVEIDAASNNSVDDIRELRDRVGFSPSEGRYRIYIIDEVHMLSTNAFNALLKTLEEPPPHARFILATTEAHKIPATVLSRCQRFDFRRIPALEIAAHLREIVDEEKFKAEEEALLAIARSAQGCMRDAISLLDQMFSYGTDEISLAQVQQVLGGVSAQVVNDFVDVVATGDIARGLGLVQRLVSDGSSLNEFCSQLVEHLRGVLMLQMAQDAKLLVDIPADTVRRMEEQARGLEPAKTLHAIKRFSEAAAELKGGYQPQLPLELALIEAAQGPAAVSVNAGAPVQTQPSATANASAPAQSPTAIQAPPQTGAPSQAPAEGAAPDTAQNATPAQEESTAQETTAQETTAQKSTAQESTAQESSAAGEPAQLDHEGAEKLRVQWKRFLDMVRDRCGNNVRAAINSVRASAVSTQSVALAFGNNEFSRDMVAKPEISKQVAQILSDLLGRPVTIECQMGETARLFNTRDVSGAGGDETASLIDYAVNELGAEVVE
ncbi:MAG: DNA polymerase III subunit gamma/tau [Litorilinea sp.]